jgi:hypothetical protein
MSVASVAVDDFPQKFFHPRTNNARKNTNLMLFTLRSFPPDFVGRS